MENLAVNLAVKKLPLCQKGARLSSFLTDLAVNFMPKSLQCKPPVLSMFILIIGT